MLTRRCTSELWLVQSLLEDFVQNLRDVAYHLSMGLATHGSVFLWTLLEEVKPQTTMILKLGAYKSM